MRKRYIAIWLLLLALVVAGCKIKRVDLPDRGLQPATIVILGSSTAAGTGPEHIASSWVNLFLAYAESLNANNRVINLAKGGYTTFHLMPRDDRPPEGRPAPDPCRCITMALHLNPSAVIINLPSNDAFCGYGVEEQLANYDRILALAEQRGIPVWITTSQPRNLPPEGRGNLLAMRDSTLARYQGRTIDFWTGLGQLDGTIDPAFDSGDGVHLNDRAHEILFRRVVEAGLLEEVAGK